MFTFVLVCATSPGRNPPGPAVGVGVRLGVLVTVGVRVAVAERSGVRVTLGVAVATPVLVTKLETTNPSMSPKRMGIQMNPSDEPAGPVPSRFVPAGAVARSAPLRLGKSRTFTPTRVRTISPLLNPPNGVTVGVRLGVLVDVGVKVGVRVGVVVMVGVAVATPILVT
jgi:hypothetical protein